MGGHDHQTGGLERAGAPDRIERILEVVRARGDGHAGLLQGGDGGQAARHRRPAATEEEEVRLGKCDDVHARLCDELGDALLIDVGSLTEAHAVTRRGGVGEAGEHGTAQFAETVDRRIERLVGVQVDADAEVRRDTEQDIGRRTEVVVEMRTSTDDVGAGAHRRTQQRPLVGAGDAGHWPASEGDDLDRDEVPELVAHGGEGLHTAQAVLQGDIDVRPDRDIAVVRHQPGRTLGPLGDVVHSGQVAVRRHRLDRTHQITRRIGDALGQERLVEVGVRLDGSRHEQATVEIDHLDVRSGRVGRPDGTDRAVDHVHIGEHIRPVEPGVHEERRGHVRETTSMSDRPELKLGAFFFGGVEMDDAGAGAPAPMDRRFSNEACWKATLDYVNSAKEAERLGYDSFWTTEHHFQYEGYEVIPNGLLISTWIAAQTTTLRLGSMFNVVPQWNPLRLAEDFATLHNLSGGRAILGVGRGTVPREVLHLNDKGVSIGSQDNPDQAADDAFNREVFEESMEIVRRALTEESFSYQGKHFQIPLPGIPDRGSTVQSLTLVPRPLYPFEIWQAVTSPPTLDYVPVVDHGAVFWNQHYSFIKRFWDRYAENYAAAHDGLELADHEKRMLVVNVRVEDTMEEARATALPGHDEFWKFLGPYGWSRGYMGPDGKPSAPGLIPTLDESIENKTMLVGPPEHVAAEVQFLRDLLGFEHLTIFPHLLGDPYKKADEQMARFAEEVVPLLS